MIVGADFYWKLVSPYKLPIERSGMWLSPDRFGRYFISGKIPGSSKNRAQQSVNYISIHQVNVEYPSISDDSAEFQILDNSEIVVKSNAKEDKEFNSDKTLRFQVTSNSEDNNSALVKLKSNECSSNEVSQYAVDFPWVISPPSGKDLISNCGLMNSRVKDNMNILDSSQDVSH